MTDPTMRELIAKGIFTGSFMRTPDHFDDLSAAWRTRSFFGADAVLAAITAAGFVIVPREATEGMIEAAATFDGISGILGSEAANAWQAMLDAAASE